MPIMRDMVGRLSTLILPCGFTTNHTKLISTPACTLHFYLTLVLNRLLN